MTILMKAAAVAVAGAIIAMLLKRSAPELGLALTLAVSLLAAGLGAGLLGELGEVLDMAREQTGLGAGVIGPVYKCVGIGVVTRLTADICKDAGQGAVSSAVELCGTVCALTAALPLVRTLLQMIGETL